MFSNNNELWQAVLGEIEVSLSKASFITWFRNTAIKDIHNETLVLIVPSIFAKEWLENKYQKLILDSIRKFHPEINKISCVIGIIDKNLDKNGRKIDSVVNLKKTISNNPVSENFSSKNSFLDSNLNPRYSFNNFVVGGNNELAYAACFSVAENPGKNFNPLFIYGGVGLGKTHLVQSTGNAILKKFPNYQIKYISMERFTNELITAIQNSKAKEFKNEYIRLNVLILDDVQFLAGKEKTQEEFFHVFESLYQAGKQLILTSDRPPKSIPTLEDRLRSRFEGGMMADVNKPDLETRLAIVRNKLNEKNFFLNEDIVLYLAENIYNNVRELEGALNKIITYFQLKNEIPTLTEVIKQTEDLISTNRKTNLTPNKIITAVADFFKVKPEEITGRCRKKNIIRPRQVVIYLMRKEINLSFPEIGNFLGGRDHSTIIYTCEKIEKELKENKLLQDHLKFIQEKFSDF